MNKHLALQSVLSLSFIFSCKASDSEIDASRFPINVGGSDLSDRLYGYIDRSGELVIPAIYRYAEPFSEGLASVRVKDEDFDKFIDESGQDAFPGQEYDIASSFSEGFALVENETYGYHFIDKSGQRAFPDLAFEYAYDFSEGFAVVQFEDENGDSYYSYLTTSGELAFGGAKYTEAESFSEGFAVVSTDDPGNIFNQQHFYINSEGQKVFAGKTFYFPSPFSEGFAVYSESPYPGSARHIINQQGNQVFGREFDFVDEFHEGFAAVLERSGLFEENTNWTYIDLTGQTAFSGAVFAYAGSFSEGFASVRDNEDSLSYFIDITGKPAFSDMYFDSAHSFKHGLARVELEVDGESKEGYINNSGEWVWDPRNPPQ